MMSMMIREEADFLLVSVLWGVGLTVLYDGLRILRIAVRHAAFMTAIEDLLYWIVTFFAVFLLLFSMNDGKVRWYALAGALAGMWLYHITVSRFLVKWLGTALGFVLKYLGKLLAFAVKGLAFPVKSVGRLLKKPVRWLTIKIRDVKNDSAAGERSREGKGGSRQKKKKVPETKQKGPSGDRTGGGALLRDPSLQDKASSGQRRRLRGQRGRASGSDRR